MKKALAMIAAIALRHSTGAQTDAFHMDCYPQTLTVEFANEAAARAAKVEILPLYHGYEWAISSRWDDNIPTDMKMRQMLGEHGYRGTFYLNATDGGYYGNDYGLISPKDYIDLGRRLADGGHSIGGHSLTHPYLTCQARNQIFHEVMGIRADRESSTGCPINTFSFPFTEFRNDIEGDSIHRDIAELMKRAGYYQIVEPWFDQPINQGFLVANLLPNDGKDIDEAFAGMLADKALQAREPNITFNMHVWYATPEAWAKFEGQLTKYGRNPKWWYCNQSEYAAYRYQYAHTELRTQVDGRRLTVALKRPALLDLNHDIPLTLQISGMNAADVRKLDCPTATVEPLEPGAAGCRFDLPHDRSQALPKRITSLDFKPGESDSKQNPIFSGLNVLFHVDGDQLRCSLKNNGAALNQLRATYRLPLAYQPGIVRKTVPKVGSGQTLDLAIPLTPSPEKTGFKYQSGEAWYYLQLDFIRDGSPGRLHLICRKSETTGDPGYPRDGFYVLGPLPDDEKAADDLAASIPTAADRKRTVTVAGSEPGKWIVKDKAATELLDPEYICTRGESHADHPEYYLLLTRIVADKAEKLTAISGEGQIPAMYLNGRRVLGNMLDLHPGGNDLLLVYYSGKDKFSARHYGPFFRLIDPSTGARATGLKYQRQGLLFQD
jgi:peptidoglycan/xylan/chitin deacetylase (PgdA/CDA1 family)